MSLANPPTPDQLRARFGMVGADGLVRRSRTAEAYRWLTLEGRMILRALHHELLVVRTCAEDVSTNRPISTEDMERLLTALSRINRAEWLLWR